MKNKEWIRHSIDDMNILLRGHVEGEFEKYIVENIKHILVHLYDGQYISIETAIKNFSDDFIPYAETLQRKE